MKIFTNNEYIIMKVLNKVSNKYYILLMRYIFILSKNLILIKINRNNEYAGQ